MTNTALLARRRIGVCGSSSLLARGATEFSKNIGRALARAGNVTIVSGSIKPHAAEGIVAAAAMADMTTEQAADRMIWFMDGGQTNPGDIVGRLERARGKTSEARRISFVRRLDALIAIRGSKGTRQELALALEFGTRILPVPAFGGAAEAVWTAYRSELISALGIDEATAQRWENLASADPAERQTTADDMVGRLLLSLPRRCFVIMPYHAEMTPLYRRVVQPAIEAAGDEAVRIDHAAIPGNVTDQIQDGLRSCDYAIAVLDEINPNVMYELGLAHAHGKTVILINQLGGLADDDVPFDIRHHQRLQYVGHDESFCGQLTDAIRSIDVWRH